MLVVVWWFGWYCFDFGSGLGFVIVGCLGLLCCVYLWVMDLWFGRGLAALNSLVSPVDFVGLLWLHWLCGLVVLRGCLMAHSGAIYLFLWFGLLGDVFFGFAGWFMFVLVFCWFRSFVACGLFGCGL